MLGAALVAEGMLPNARCMTLKSAAVSNNTTRLLGPGQRAQARIISICMGNILAPLHAGLAFKISANSA